MLCSSGLGQVGDDMLISLLNISTENTRSNRLETAASADIDKNIQNTFPKYNSEQNMDLASAVSTFEKQLLEQVLSDSSSLREAGEKLGLNASTICRKIKQYNIDYDKKKNTQIK